MGQIKTQESDSKKLEEDNFSLLEVPDIFSVIIHNDNYTPMDFVILLLQEIFDKDYESSHKIMMNIHTKGWDICGSFPYEIAEMKVIQVVDRAQSENYPLRCTFKKFE
jgi:ATP-dependent Clp protease adaptor protein ClpS